MPAGKRGIDTMLLAMFTGLLLFGLLMLTSAGSIGGYFKEETFYYVTRQLMFGVLPGLVAGYIMYRVPYSFWERASVFVFLGTVLLLALVFVPGIGATNNTVAKNWINIGNYSLQPVEFAKLGVIMFLAAFMARRGEAMRTLEEGFLPALIMAGIPLLMVVLQPDIGGASILFAITLGLLFVGGSSMTAVGGLLGLGVIGVACASAWSSHAAARIGSFFALLRGGVGTDAISYQIYNALIAVGSGGWWGLGYAHSKQKFGYLPEVHADSIFAIIAEEMGFFLSAFLILLLVVIAWRALSVARRAPDAFGTYVASGIVIWFMVQSFFNIGAMIGILPLTGVPLPFVSHGGTALMTAMAAVGLLLNISTYTEGRATSRRVSNEYRRAS